jgi:hypothetical protein
MEPNPIVHIRQEDWQELEDKCQRVAAMIRHRDRLSLEDAVQLGRDLRRIRDHRVAMRGDFAGFLEKIRIPRRTAYTYINIGTLDDYTIGECSGIQDAVAVYESRRNPEKTQAASDNPSDDETVRIDQTTSGAEADGAPGAPEDSGAATEGSEAGHSPQVGVQDPAPAPDGGSKPPKAPPRPGSFDWTSYAGRLRAAIRDLDLLARELGEVDRNGAVPMTPEHLGLVRLLEEAIKGAEKRYKRLKRAEQ